MSESPPKLAVSLMGPTACGKTALALWLHEHLPVEIISVDSSQVYRGLDIGTAKPSSAEQARAPHRLIDIRDPAVSYSAAEFRADALREMGDIERAGRIPLLVGGTMFYFHALEYGLSPMPAADPDVRARLADEAARLGWPAMHSRLREIDPVTASRIGQRDAQRIQRALELFELSGETPSALANKAPPEPAPWRFLKFALLPHGRVWLHERISARFAAMLQRGLVDEVASLLARGDLNADLPSIRSVGYRQVWEYLTGSVNYSEMSTKALSATRQLAKRQLTWLRSYRDVVEIEVAHGDHAERVLTQVRRAMDMRNMWL